MRLAASTAMMVATGRGPTVEEAQAVVDTVEDWQDVFTSVLGRRLVFAADEYYLLAGRPFPEPEAYEGFPMHEDGIGMARTFELELTGRSDGAVGPLAVHVVLLGSLLLAGCKPTTEQTGAEQTNDLATTYPSPPVTPIPALRMEPSGWSLTTVATPAVGTKQSTAAGNAGA